MGGKVEEDEAVGMRYCKGGWVGGRVDGWEERGSAFGLLGG